VGVLRRNRDGSHKLVVLLVKGAVCHNG
jgi:hypothetical protein